MIQKNTKVIFDKNLSKHKLSRKIAAKNPIIIKILRP